MTRHAARSLRLREARDPFVGTTAVNAEEQIRGWLAEINRQREVYRQIVPYGRLVDLIEFFKDFPIVRFNQRAAEEFERLRKQRIRIGTMDLKIASIAIVHDALLLSANLVDFQKVPGLNVENWLR